MMNEKIEKDERAEKKPYENSRVDQAGECEAINYRGTLKYKTR